MTRKPERVTVEDMRQHVRNLCKKHAISLQAVDRGRRAYAIPEFHEIGIPLIRSAISYATAMHEIGHHRGHHQNSRRTMVRERWAWRWARSNSLIWTPAMERSSLEALEWYASRVAKIDRKQAQIRRHERAHDKGADR